MFFFDQPWGNKKQQGLFVENGMNMTSGSANLLISEKKHR